ncbi:hypothetical protein [Hymenobacter psoromatis]|nr:hypothetical protein [Hymenobacter psoromatis]
MPTPAEGRAYGFLRLRMAEFIFFHLKISAYFTPRPFFSAARLD